MRDLELLVHEPWRVASKERSSTTREYIGAVVDIAALRDGRGELETEAAFYRLLKLSPDRPSPTI